MSKILNGLFLVVIAGAAAAPYYVGTQIESQYQQSIIELNKTYAGQMVAKGTYTRGFFTSHAVTEINFTNGTTPLKLEHTIHNGPVILDFQSPTDYKSYIPHGIKYATVDTIIDAGNFNELLKKVYKDKPAYTLATEFMFDGSGSTTLTNFPFSMQLGEGEINWKGMSLTIFHTKNFTSTNSLLSIPGLTYSEMTADMAKKNEFRIADIKLNYESGGAASAEKVDFTIDSISITEGSITVFNADRLKVKGDYSRSNKLIKSDVTYGFNKLVFGSDEYGPMQLVLKFNNVDEDLIDHLSANMGTTLGTDGVPKPADFMSQIHSSLTPEQLKAALVAMPSTDVDWTLTTPKGKVSIKGNLTAGDKNLTTVDAASVLPTLNGKGTIKIDQGLLYAILAQYAETDITRNAQMFAITNQDPNLLNPYTLTPQQRQPIIEAWVIMLLDKLKDKSILLEKDGVISMDAQLAKSAMTVNGKSFKRQDLMEILPLFDIVLAPKVNTAPNPNIMPAPSVMSAPAPTAPNTNVAPAAPAVINTSPVAPIVTTPSTPSDQLPMTVPPATASPPSSTNLPTVQQPGITTPPVTPQPIPNARESLTVPPAEDPRGSSSITGNPSAADIDVETPVINEEPNKKQQ